MDRVQPGYVQLILHDDENTPQNFVTGLLRSVFSQSPADAFEVMVTIGKQGKAVCGTYPRAVAEALLQAHRSESGIGPSTGDDGPGRR